MSASSSGRPEQSSVELHRARGLAESFGVNVVLYDKARPPYPSALIERIVAGIPGRNVVDVGCGTGIAARQFQAVGCSTLGVEPDERMAEFARSRGVPIEVATFEVRTWQEGRSTQSLPLNHGIGSTRSSARRRQPKVTPHGATGNFRPRLRTAHRVAQPFATALRRVVPDSPFASMPARRSIETYQKAYARVADTIRATNQSSAPEQWRFDWEQSYTRSQWLALLPTTGVLTRLTRVQQSAILEQVSAAIDDLGGSFTMSYTTLAATAQRTPQ